MRSIGALIGIFIIGAVAIVGCEWYLDTLETQIRRDEAVQYEDTIEELQLIVAGLTEGNAIVTAELTTSINNHEGTKKNYRWQSKKWKVDKRDLGLCVASLRAKGW